MEVGIQIDATRAPLARADLTARQLARTEEPPHSLDVDPEQICGFFWRDQVRVLR